MLNWQPFLGLRPSQTTFRVHDEPNPVSGTDGLRAAVTLPRQGAADMECNARTCGIGSVTEPATGENPASDSSTGECRKVFLG